MDTLYIKATVVPGFRRVGRFFSYEGDLVPTEAFTKEQLAAIKREPRLVVSNVPDEAVAKLQQEKKAQTDQDTLQEIVEAITVLAPETKPNVKTVEEVLDYDINAAQRDAAWALYLEAVGEEG